jgi:hypothetical protein
MADALVMQAPDAVVYESIKPIYADHSVVVSVTNNVKLYHGHWTWYPGVGGGC